MKFSRSIGQDEEMIPTASVADITFLLIIFFMVGTVFNVERGIQMQLPATTTQQDLTEKNVVIMIDAAEDFYIDGDKIELAQIGKTTRDKLGGRTDRFVLIKADQGVKYRKVVDVLDELLQVGVDNIALPTEKEGE